MNRNYSLVEVSTGECHPLNNSPFLVGRSAKADLPITAFGAARKQFQILEEGSQRSIEPLSFEPPVWLNGKPLKEKTLLVDGSTIKVGDQEFIFKSYASRRNTHSYSERSLNAAAAGVPTNEKDDGKTRIGKLDDYPIVDEGLVFDIRGTMVVGRDMQTADIYLPHRNVSRRHLEISKSEPGIQVADLGSSNGTFVNGKRVFKSTTVKEGDRIDVGPYSLTISDGQLVSATRRNNSQLECKELTYQVTDRETGNKISLVEDVSLVIRPKEFVCLIGPSGSGKSTLLGLLSARMPVSSGAVGLNSLDLYDRFESLKKDIAVVPQKDVVHEQLTVEEALTFSAKLRLPDDTEESEISKLVDDMLTTVDLQHRRSTQIRNLSGGQLKRASLANEIICGPSLIFLDEVTSGLDEQSDREMMSLFRQLADDGKTVICVTHSTANVAANCDRVIVMANGGRLAFYGSPEDATEYFEVNRLGDIYPRLAQKNADQWANEFRLTDLYTNLVVNQMTPIEKTGNTESKLSPLQNFLESFPKLRQQIFLLCKRHLKLIWADKLSLLLVAAQALLVATLVIALFGDISEPEPTIKSRELLSAEYSGAILFLLTISCIWFGCNNAAKEIVKEKTIFAREKDVNLEVVSYVASKILLLGCFSIFQATVLFFLVSFGCSLPGNSIAQWVMLLGMTLCGVAIGLLISSFSNSEDMAVTLVPITLIPQVILAGLLAPLSGFILWVSRLFITSYWGYQTGAATLPSDLATSLDKDENSYIGGLLMLLLHFIVISILTSVILAMKHERKDLSHRFSMLTDLTAKIWPKNRENSLEEEEFFH